MIKECQQINSGHFMVIKKLFRAWWLFVFIHLKLRGCSAWQIKTKTLITGNFWCDFCSQCRGIIWPPGWNWVKVSENLGATAVAPVASQLRPWPILNKTKSYPFVRPEISNYQTYNYQYPYLHKQMKREPLNIGRWGIKLYLCTYIGCSIDAICFCFSFLLPY